MKRAVPFSSVLLVLTLMGCSTDQLRLQSEDDDKGGDKKADVRTVGDVTSVWGADPVRVMGVGVVQGLAGTGSDPAPGEVRRQVLHDLKSMGVESASEFLASPNTAVVMVTAVLPPGCQKDDPIDVDVELLPRDKASSLRGGVLLECSLREYADSHDLKGQGPHASLKGRVLLRAEGPVLVGLGGSDDKDRQRKGRIWGGGKCLIDRNFALILKKENQDGRTSRMIADRVNERFNGPQNGTMKGMAEAKTTSAVALKIPSAYKHNYPRFLRVVRQVPLRESAVVRAHYQRQVAEELLDPAMTVTAALKLEALGSEAAADLKKAQRSTHPLVRFCASEALAYLGDPASAEPLAQLIEQEPRFRTFGLTALASLPETVSHVQLRRLLSSKSAETRYGAFKALRTLDDKDEALNEAAQPGRFALHQVAEDSPPMVHVSTSRRAEIVLFGKEPMLLPPFTLQAGPEFVVTAADGSEQCIVTRISLKNGTRKEVCSLRASEVISMLGGMGAGYADVVELLQQAGKYENLDCPVVVDAVPQAPSVFSLALSGVRDKRLSELDESEELLVDLGSAPNLFAQPQRKGSKGMQAAEHSRK